MGSLEIRRKGILVVTGAEECKEYVHQASGVLPISRKACCLHSGYCTRKIMNDITLLGAEKTMSTRVAPVRCVRVYELSYRKTKHENDSEMGQV